MTAEGRDILDMMAWIPPAMSVLYGTWMFAGVMRRRKRVEWDRVRAPGSTWILFALLTANIVVSGAEGALRGLPAPGWTSAPGSLLLCTKAVVTVWAVRSLGNAYSYHLCVPSGTRVVRSGPYRWVRHPMYAARLTATVGIPLTFGAWVTLPVILFLDLGAVLHRIREEERLLSGALREEYETYARQTGALLPLRALRARTRPGGAAPEVRNGGSKHRMESNGNRIGEESSLSKRVLP
jgi:protein-S-isoprenylcysteine O-methyltransferase Ste14